MGDAELDAIRQKRLAELSGGQAGASNGSDNAEDQAKQAQEAEEMRRTAMSQILDPQARERLARISLVRPERGRSLEDLLVRMARSGQLRGRVSDDQLLSLLDQVAEAENKQTGAGAKSKITISRRQDKSVSDDDDDFDDDYRIRPSEYTTLDKSGSQHPTKSKIDDDDDDDIFDM